MRTVLLIGQCCSSCVANENAALIRTGDNTGTAY